MRWPRTRYMLMSWKMRACFSAHPWLPGAGLESTAHLTGT